MHFSPTQTRPKAHSSAPAQASPGVLVPLLPALAQVLVAEQSRPCSQPSLPRHSAPSLPLPGLTHLPWEAQWYWIWQSELKPQPSPINAVPGSPGFWQVPVPAQTSVSAQSSTDLHGSPTPDPPPSEPMGISSSEQPGAKVRADAASTSANLWIVIDRLLLLSKQPKCTDSPTIPASWGVANLRGFGQAATYFALLRRTRASSASAASTTHPPLALPEALQEQPPSSVSSGGITFMSAADAASAGQGTQS